MSWPPRMPIAPPTLRPATIDDATVLAELVNHAGDGMPLYLWGQMAEPGEAAWAVGRQRASREEGSFSYRNATIIEQDSQCAGCLIGYRFPTILDRSPMTCPRCSFRCNNWKTSRRGLVHKRAGGAATISQARAWHQTPGFGG